eukprot:14668374-Heterocapsa_arctica.AAC.1
MGELGEFHPDKDRWAVMTANSAAVLLKNCNVRDGRHLMYSTCTVCNVGDAFEIGDDCPYCGAFWSERPR